MKRLIIAACTASLFSGAALAGPHNKHGKAHKHATQHAQNKHSKHKLHRDLFNLALFVGTAFAIDAALDNHGDKHDSRHQRRYDDRPNNRHDNRHAGRHNSGPSSRPQADRHDRRHHAQQNINQRQDRQHRRIRQGVRSGELVRKEAQRLRKQQRHIADLERNFRADGRFNKKERQIIVSKLDNASERIYKLKHNDRYRY